MSPLEKIAFQYQGFINQPNLWEETSFFEYPQLEIPYSDNIEYNSIDTHKHHRLGKLVEVFFERSLQQLGNYNTLVNNLQIQADKHNTLGELDFIIEHQKEIFHIELAYKFYLYNPIHDIELNRWVGPNLRDSLTLKLKKLKEKQFPILYNPYTQNALNKLNIDSLKIKQRVIFKAQLYIPLSLKGHHFDNINNNSIAGYYISHKEIDFLFPLALYHLPEKKDWLIHPKHNTQWLTFTEIKPLILHQLKNQHSPLLWIKRNHIFERFFITFW